MSETFITIIAVITVALIMFIFPVMAMADQNDDITQTSVDTMAADFVNTVAKEGKITANNYDEFVQKLHATGNTYLLELEVQHLDDNPAKKGQNINVIGENIYYSVFTNAIEEELKNNQVYLLKQGDYIKARITNTNVTFGTQMKNFLYSVMGKDTIAIESSHSALVMTTGAK